MSKPFEFRDFSKRYNDLSSNNFPSLNKAKVLEDSIKFKLSSKAQKGVKLDSSVTNKGSSTESDFGVKLNFEDFEGLELGYKIKSQPSSELTFRFDDKRIPLEGSAFTLKLAGASPGEQTVGGTFNFGNKLVNLNLSVAVPFARRVFSYVTDEEKLNNQRVKVDFDFVSRPVEDKDFFFGGDVKAQLPKDDKELLYTSRFSAGLNNTTTNGGLYVDHKKETDDKKYKHSTSYGAWVYTEVEDLSVGSKVSYNPSNSGDNGKGFEFELVGGLQRDSNSKLSSKVTVVPTTTVSLGYEQKLSSATKLTFGYAFLLNKTNENSSAYSFGVEISH